MYVFAQVKWLQLDAIAFSVKAVSKLSDAVVQAEKFAGAFSWCEEKVDGVCYQRMRV